MSRAANPQKGQQYMEANLTHRLIDLTIAISIVTTIVWAIAEINWQQQKRRLARLERSRRVRRHIREATRERNAA